MDESQQPADAVDLTSTDTRVAWPLRCLVYTLLLVSAFASMTVRLGWTERKVGNETSPMLSANDRSRWVTVRALIETGGYEIDRYTRDPIESRHWNTIDKVVHEGADGRLREYSSKPPLLATAVAGVYAAGQRLGWLDFNTNLFPSIRGLLLVCQILPLTITLGVFAWFLDRWPGVSELSRFFTFAAACWGTHVTTFAVTLNNHHFAVLAVYWSLFALVALWRHPQRSGWWIVLGASGGLAAANELPALAWTVMVVIAGFGLNRERAWRWLLPALLVVALAYFGTNLIAHRTLRMPYSFRSDGPVLLTVDAAFAEDLQAGPMPIEMRRQLNRQSARLGLQLGPFTWIEDNQYPLPGWVAQRWVIRDYVLGPAQSEQWRALAVVKPRGSEQIEIRAWENWYDYPGSYWHDQRRGGIDAGEPSVVWYAFHCLIGHHGYFSLTPLWLLSVWGAWAAWRSPAASGPNRHVVRGAVLAVVALSLVVIGFYLSRPLLDRNYGGQASALRWLFWLSPLWLVALVPAIDSIRRRPWALGLAWLLLLLSAASALMASTNPWVHPWLYALWPWLYQVWPWL